MASQRELPVIKKIGLTVLLATLCGVASAKDTCKIEHFLGFPIEVCTPAVGGGGSTVRTAPELDPGSLMSGFTLLVGGLTVLRAGRRKHTDA
jgi:hypothetical protein